MEHDYKINNGPRVKET